MFRNRVWLLGAVLGLSIFMLTAPASAWEFKMVGSFSWEYEYMTQLGRSGFFGPYDVDARAAGVADANSLNAWLGSQANDITVSGADGVWNTFWMELWPEIRFNPAVRVRGLYRIGAWWPGAATSPSGTTGVLDSAAGPSLVRSEYTNYLHPGIYRSFSPGYWNLLWLTAQLPWGQLAIGKRPSTWGAGLAWNGEDNRTSESLSLTTFYGPLRIAIGLYPARQGYEGYYNDYFDKSGLRIHDMVLPNITYRNGPLDAGVIFNLGPTRHRGPERAQNTAGTKSNQETRDREDYYGGAYVKYNNGRFFLNSEFNFYNRRDQRRDRNSFPGGFATNYIENYRVMAELGTICGPAKVSLLYAWLSGNDRRGGYRNNINQGTVVDPFGDSTTTPTAATALGSITPRWTSSSLSNQGMFRPYSYLMVQGYGVGAYINADNRKGYVEDASCFGGRLDYAVASNLNLYGSFFWADRVGNGYGWGFLLPSDVQAPAAYVAGGFPNDTFGLVRQQYKGTFNGAGTVATVAPTIPDNNLGWEVDGGFDWKLLEGLTLNATFGYWQPGKWFNFACVSKTNAGWTAPSAANGWGINPNRTIDPIYGMEMKIVGDF